MSDFDAAEEPIIKLHYKKGDHIFFEGDLDTHFFIVESGSILIYTKNKKGKRVDICTIFDGESFGEFALLDNKPRSASAQALSDSVVVRISTAGYNELLNELPGWAVAMLKSFSLRLKQMTELVKNLGDTVTPATKSSTAQSQDLDFDSMIPEMQKNLDPKTTTVELIRAKPTVAPKQESIFFDNLEKTNVRAKKTGS